MKKEFLYGVATAATQIEGGAFQDGKGKSIWDYYSEKKLIAHGEDCFICCDSYNKLEEDLNLIKELGVNSYRFSINWTRIQPKGYGEINKKGIEYYNRLIDGLLKINVKPFITLFHWDLPIELYQKGGFLNRDIVERFEEYGRIIAENFSDRVEMFSVFNESMAIIDFMYNQPVGKLDPVKNTQELFVAIHNLLLCNGASIKSLKKYSKQKISVGMVNCCNVCVPVSEKDIEAARKGTFTLSDNLLTNNVTFWDPVIFGKYNEDWLKKYELDSTFIQEEDMKIIKCNLDFMGINIYGGSSVIDDGNGNPKHKYMSRNSIIYDMGDDVINCAAATYWGPKFINEKYGLPIYITENGTSMPEWIDCEGKVEDSMRADFINRFSNFAIKAVEDGIDLRGYFVWSLMDNFEWSSGFTRRFVLVYIDYDNLNRIKKTSFYKYKELIKCYKKRLKNNVKKF